MTTQLIPFQFESSSIRVITHDDGAWSVVAKDVAESLGYSWQPAVVKHVPDEWKGIIPINTPGGTQEMLTLTEQGLYFFLGRSDKPKALPFQKWVYGDVIPSIRKTGSYALPAAKPTATPDDLLLKNRRAKSTLSLYMTAAKWLGTDAPMARAIAVDAVKQQTGVDLQPLLGGNAIEENPMTPTELGKPLNWTGRAMNARLALAGLQDRNENGEWVPTDKGKPYCTVNPYKAPHSEHTGYRVLWYRTVLALFPVPAKEEAV